MKFKILEIILFCNIVLISAQYANIFKLPLIEAPKPLPPEIFNNYAKGVKHFNDTLLSLINYKNGESIVNLFKTLFLSVNSGFQSFKKSHRAVLDLKDELALKEAELAEQIDEKKQALKERTAQKYQKKLVLNDQQKALQGAKHQQNSSEEQLRRLQEEVEEATAEAHKARHRCWHKLKGMDIGDLAKKAQKAIKDALSKGASLLETGICTAYNSVTGRLSRLEKIKAAAEEDLMNYKNTVEKDKQDVSNTLENVNALSKEIEAAENSVIIKNTLIDMMHSKMNKTQNLKRKIVEIEKHLWKVLIYMPASVDGIKVFQAKKLLKKAGKPIPFDTVIFPLFIAGQLISQLYDSPVPTMMILTNDIRQKISENVQNVKNILGGYEEEYGEEAELNSERFSGYEEEYGEEAERSERFSGYEEEYGEETELSEPFPA